MRVEQQLRVKEEKLRGQVLGAHDGSDTRKKVPLCGDPQNWLRAQGRRALTMLLFYEKRRGACSCGSTFRKARQRFLSLLCLLVSHFTMSLSR